ncbi:hypothetical protein [Niabella hirudinis]|uniref:hypothetical protein n=1 Tax=Niabella hirudinis TaxID=1285929 RepID=UPI003EBB1115
MKNRTPFFFILVMALTTILSCSKNDSPAPPAGSEDSFTVIVNNGYGSGSYKIGDTVHLFSNHYADNQLFDKWTGDVALLKAPDEWHTWFIMPNRKVSVTGSVKNSVAYTLQYEQIMGRDRLKPVYYYFPAGHKGVVYLLHGTNGSAASVVGGYEFQLLIRDLINDNFGVVITEAEEATTGIDANGDGKLRWAILPADINTNVDFANIRILTESLYNKGVTNSSKPKYAIGMSDGGFFSSALSFMYHYRAGVNYCSQGSPVVIATTLVPTLFCMERNDDNPSVGQAGNAAALSNSNSLNARGVCSNYFVNERSPVYTARFARQGDITVAQSVSIFNELKNKGFIDDNNYFVGYSDAFLNAYQNSPGSFPVINGLSFSQKTTVLGEINLSVADHHMYSDFNRKTLRFLNTLCQ